MSTIRAAAKVVPIMRRSLLSFALIGLALIVVGISLAVLRSLHRSVLLYILLVPIWISVLEVLVKVRGPHSESARRGTAGDFARRHLGWTVS